MEELNISNIRKHFVSASSHEGQGSRVKERRSMVLFVDESCSSQAHKSRDSRRICAHVMLNVNSSNASEATSSQSESHNDGSAHGGIRA
jgi:hypothetical protein